MTRWIDTLVEFSVANLNENEHVCGELWARGVSDAQILEYHIGYLNKRLPPLDGAEDFLEWCWQGRKLDDMYVFPMTNALGQVKGLQFRHVDRKAKGYTDYLVDKDEPALVGLAQAMPHVWRTQSVWLVEGAFDMFPIQRVYPNVIPTMTAAVSTSLMRFLKRNVRDVWLGYDTDRTGYFGAREVAEQATDDFRVHIPKLPILKFFDGRSTKDPADLWEVLGDDRFGVYLRNQTG
jgi:DNA primase